MSQRRSSPKQSASQHPGLQRHHQTTIILQCKHVTAWAHTLLPHLAREARNRGWRLINLFNQDWLPPTNVKLHGAIVQSLPGTPWVESLRKRGCKVVRLGSFPHPDDSALPAVLPDTMAEGRMAARFFSERGFRQVCCVEHDPPSLMRDMFDAFRREAELSGMTCHILRFSATDRKESSQAIHARRRRDLVAWLKELPKPCGFLCRGDSAATEALFLAIEAGLKVPGDIAVLGRGNNVDVCESLFPSLSSIDNNESERAKVACDILSGLIEGKLPPAEATMVPPKGIVERESTNILGVMDPDVARAVDYLWTNLHKDVSVDEVAGSIGVPRRRLERAFQASLGRGINAELLRKRLQVLGELLHSTDETIADLAGQVGFRSMAHLYRSFRKTYGMSPMEYRKSVIPDDKGLHSNALSI